MSIPGPRSTVDEKLDFLIKSAMNTNTQFTELRATLTDNCKRIVTVERDVGHLQKEVTELKHQVNRHEQISRSLLIRISNIPVSPDESAARLAYDRAIRPILALAKDKGMLTAVPQFATVIVEAYRMRSRSGAAPTDYPPHIMVRLSSALFKSAIFTHKREGLPALQGAKRINIMEELTPTTYRFLKSLKADPRFSSAWTVEGQVRFIIAEDPSKSIRRVVSVFDPLESLLNT